MSEKWWSFHLGLNVLTHFSLDQDARNLTDDNFKSISFNESIQFFWFLLQKLLLNIILWGLIDAKSSLV